MSPALLCQAALALGLQELVNKVRQESRVPYQVIKVQVQQQGQGEEGRQSKEWLKLNVGGQVGLLPICSKHHLDCFTKYS